MSYTIKKSPGKLNVGDNFLYKNLVYTVTNTDGEYLVATVSLQKNLLSFNSIHEKNRIEVRPTEFKTDNVKGEITHAVN